MHQQQQPAHRDLANDEWAVAESAAATRPQRPCELFEVERISTAFVIELAGHGIVDGVAEEVLSLLTRQRAERETLKCSRGGALARARSTAGPAPDGAEPPG